jgi:hypothetical protein
MIGSLGVTLLSLAARLLVKSTFLGEISDAATACSAVAATIVVATGTADASAINDCMNFDFRFATLSLVMDGDR